MSSRHAERTHAPFAPSAAHRWLACPASVRLIAKLPESPRAPDPAADFGTACHELAETLLRKRVYRLEVTDDRALAAFERFRAAHAADTTAYTLQRMVDAVNTYLAYVEERLADTGLFDSERVLVIERRVQVVRKLCTGTVDAALAWRDEHGVAWLEVIDLKTGAQPVEAAENPQLLTYAVGLRHALKRAVDRVRLTIVQPDRYDVAVSGATVTWETDGAALTAFEQQVRAAIERAETEAPQLGPHCAHCPALALCPAQHDRMRALLPTEPAHLPPADTLTPQQLAFVLQHKRAIIAWLEACEQLALQAPPPGWRVVDGAPRRKMRDKDAVLAVLERLQVPKDLLIATEERVVTVAEAERRLKQHPQRDEILANIIELVPGSPKLMPVVGEDPVAVVHAHPVAAP